MKLQQYVKFLGKNYKNIYLILASFFNAIVLMLKSCGNKSTIFLLFRNNRFKQPNLFSLKKVKRRVILL
ncbi:Uncharacterised protein [Mycobacteroides abscessus subsp. abscessus]|nr:Uncharacterised protein [Mycobacteroides abscessus subsp. abscessus]